MLTLKNQGQIPNRLFFVLLLFVSSFTFQSFVAADSKSDLAEEYHLKGLAEYQKGNYYAALSFYNKAIGLGLDNPVVLNDMGVLYEQIGFSAKARSMYLSAIRADEKYLPPYMNLGYLFLGEGNNDAAAQYFKQRFALANPDDEYAARAKEELIKIKPEYRTWVVTIESERMNQEIARKARQEFLDKVSRSSGHYEKGRMFQQNGDFNNALAEYNKALYLTPNNPKVMDAKADLMRDLTQKDAQKHTDQAMKMLSAGDTYSAKKEIQKVLSIIPNEPNLNSR